MHKKTVVLLCLCAALLMTLAGCSGASAGDTAEEKDGSTQQEILVADDTSDENVPAIPDNSSAEPSDKPVGSGETDGTATSTDKSGGEDAQEPSGSTVSATPLGESATIEGYELLDGDSVPITVSMRVTDVKSGDEAFTALGDPAAPEPGEGQEYVVVTLSVTYEDGDANELFMAENIASLPSARVMFTLSNGSSNAEGASSYLADSIYDCTIEKGDTAAGSVAFLRKAGTSEPLYFVGFNGVMCFELLSER